MFIGCFDYLFFCETLYVNGFQKKKVVHLPLVEAKAANQHYFLPWVLKSLHGGYIFLRPIVSRKSYIGTFRAMLVYDKYP